MGEIWAFGWLNKIDVEKKRKFIIFFGMTLLVHAYIMLNYLPNHDGLCFFYHDQDIIYSGRWFLKFAAGISSYYYMQWLIGVLSAFYIAVSAVLVVEMLNIKNFVLAILGGATICCYPAVACTYRYMYTADAYFLAMLMSVIGAWLLVSGKWKTLIGGIILGFGMGIYQAYIAFAVVLLGIWLIKQVISQNKVFVRALIRIVCGLLIAGGTYVIGLRWRLEGRSLSSYQGIGDAGGLHSIRWYVDRVLECYRSTFDMIFSDDTFQNEFFIKIAVFIWGLTFVLLLVRTVDLIKKRDWSCVWIWIITLVLPIGCFLMNLASDNVSYHKLMLQSVAVLWIMPIMLIDMEIKNKKRVLNICAQTMVVAIALNVGNYIVGNNMIYLASSIEYEKTYALSVRMVDRMEQLDGYESAQYLYIEGAVSQEDYSNEALCNKLEPLSGSRSGGIITYYNLIHVRMINQFIGGNYNALTNTERVEEIKEMQEYKEMPTWPVQGSVRIIDDVIVIKLSE